MLQRIQTVYLFLVIVSIVMLIFFPIAEFKTADSSLEYHIEKVANSGYSVFPNEVISNESLSKFMNYVPFILATVLLSMTLVSIFSFRDRTRQMKINAFSLIIAMILVFTTLYYADLLTKKEEISSDFDYKLGAAFPIISLVFIVLANRAIKKDEAKVKAADRIR